MKRYIWSLSLFFTVVLFVMNVSIAHSYGVPGGQDQGGGSAACDNWAPHGSTHRNNGNGCYYTCNNGSWGSPERCDGGGNGLCQGCGTDSAAAARAVAQRQREAEQQIQRQGGLNSAVTRQVQQETQQKFNISVNQEVARRNAVAAPETPAGQGGGAVADNACDPSGGSTGEAGPRSACCMGGVVECGEGTTGQCVGAGIGTIGFCEPASGDSPAAAAGGRAGAGTAPTAAQLAQLDAQLNECLYDENVMIEGTLDAQCISRLSRIQNTLTATTTLTPDQIRARRQIQGDFVTAQADLSRVQALCDSASAPETCQQDVAAAEQRVAQTSQAVNTQITSTAVRERLTQSAGNYSAHIGQYTADKISKAINAEDTMQGIRDKCGVISDAEQQTRCLRLEMQVQLGLDLDTKTGEIVQDENSAFFNSYCLNITQRGMLRETEATAEDREAVKNALAHCGNQVRTAAVQEIRQDGPLTLRPAISDGERCAFPGGCRCSQDGQEWTTARASTRCVAPPVAGNTCTQSQQGERNQNGTLRCDCAADAPAGDLQCGWVEVAAVAEADTTRVTTPAIGVTCTRGADDTRRAGDDAILTCVCNPVSCSWMLRSVDSSEVVTADPGVVRESQLDEYVVSNPSQCTGNMRGCQLPNDPSRYVCVSVTLYPETSTADAGCGRWIEDVRTGVASAPIGFAPDNLVSSNATDQEVEQSIADNLSSCGGEGQAPCIVTTTGNTSVAACDTNLSEVNGICQQVQSPATLDALTFELDVIDDTLDDASCTENDVMETDEGQFTCRCVNSQGPCSWVLTPSISPVETPDAPAANDSSTANGAVFCGPNLAVDERGCRTFAGVPIAVRCVDGPAGSKIPRQDTSCLEPIEAELEPEPTAAPEAPQVVPTIDLRNIISEVIDYGANLWNGFVGLVAVNNEAVIGGVLDTANDQIDDFSSFATIDNQSPQDSYQSIQESAQEVRRRCNWLLQRTSDSQEADYCRETLARLDATIGTPEEPVPVDVAVTSALLNNSGFVPSVVVGDQDNIISCGPNNSLRCCADGSIPAQNDQGQVVCANQAFQSPENTPAGAQRNCNDNAQGRAMRGCINPDNGAWYCVDANLYPENSNLPGNGCAAWIEDYQSGSLPAQPVLGPALPPAPEVIPTATPDDFGDAGEAQRTALSDDNCGGHNQIACNGSCDDPTMSQQTLSDRVCDATNRCSTVICVDSSQAQSNQSFPACDPGRLVNTISGSTRYTIDPSVALNGEVCQNARGGRQQQCRSGAPTYDSLTVPNPKVYCP